MNLELSDIVFLLLIFALIYGWWQNTKIREKATITAKQHCQGLNLQFLDESVAGQSWKPMWVHHQPCIRRTFSFEFTSTGRIRYEGHITFVGNSPSNIWLSPYDI